MKKILNFGIGLLLCSFTSAFAGQLMHFGIQPVAIKVNFGAVNKSYVLNYYIVSDSPTSPQAIFDFAIVPISTQAHKITIGNIQTSCGGILPARPGTCAITVPFTVTGNQYGSSQFLPPETYQFQFKYNSMHKQSIASNPFTVSYATGQPDATASRTFTFKNQCTIPVTLGIASGAAASINPNPAIVPQDLQSCLIDTDCYPGSKCIPVTSTLKHCFWLNPTPQNSQYTLAANTGNTTAVFPAYDNGVDIIWSGGIAGRTGCVNGTCDTADCGTPTPGTIGACKIASGFQQPVSMTEFTLTGNTNLVVNTDGQISTNTDVDTYDTTIINGINKPISMSPNNAVWQAGNPYRCGTPGAVTPHAPLGGCSWDFTRYAPPSPSTNYIWVKFDPHATTCTADSNTCSTGEVCGTSYNPAATPGQKIIPNKCGQPLGYWTADAICALDAKYTAAPFNCPSLVQGNLTYADLYGCSTGALKQSCYSGGAANTCCGCADWQTIPGITVPASTTLCVNKNSKWIANSQPQLEWLKKACPTAYVYPYDDQSSTFTCQILNAAKMNAVNYTITFCPKT